MSDRLQQLLQFHEQDPQDAFCAYGIAMELRKQGRDEEALDWFEKTLAADPHHAYACYQMARLLADGGKLTEARAAVERGLEAARAGGDAHATSELEALRQTLE